MPVKPDPQEIARALRILMRSHDGVFEIRAPQMGRAHRDTASGYFTLASIDKAVAAAARLSGQAPTVGFCLNPVDPSLHARAHDRIELPASHATKDTDIVRRIWLLADFDPVRASGVSSKDQEHDAAIARAIEARTFMRVEYGWGDCVLADSGNGAHLLFAIDEPNDEATRELCTNVLKMLSLNYSHDGVVVDVATFNASRCAKVYGTVAAKGDDTPDRPHRVSRILMEPSPDDMD